MQGVGVESNRRPSGRKREAAMQKWEHCELKGNSVVVMSRGGLRRKDTKLIEHNAWKSLEDDGWELVSVVTDQEGEFRYYFKRPVE
jgi:hypothetical protein